MRFTFNLAGRRTFFPTLFIPAGPAIPLDRMDRSDIASLVFHIGLTEMISYWKAACPPRVIIRPFSLSPEQAGWWRSLFFHGLGEFLYLNGIATSEEDLLTLESAGPSLSPLRVAPDDGIVVPVGGGKDSAVSLEVLGKHADCIPLVMNPRGASLHTVQAAGYNPDSILRVIRTLDPGLLRMNEEGFLNGHTPFSALLAFVTLLGAVLSGHRYIALSNESSANEATIGGTGINHQYSKSFRFESDFREYVRRWISPEISYFSFLRPLDELQIARLFSRMTRYHPVFRSCNVGSKTDSWCGQCAKCLFTYVILSPFLSDEALRGIFGKDLLADANLIPLLDQLAGIAEEKPFDCVGTIREVNVALCEAIRRHEGTPLPALLQYYRQTTAFSLYQGVNIRMELTAMAAQHHLDKRFMQWLAAEMEG